MGQCFYIFNLDKRQSVAGGKFGEWFPSGEATVLTDLLLGGGVVEFPPDPYKGQPCKQATKKDPSKRGICDLPLELKCAIFDEIDEPADAFSLCLTASHFWMVGIYRLKQFYEEQARSIMGSWAGDRLICLGEYAEDLPEGVMTEEELEELEGTFELYYCLRDTSSDPSAKWRDDDFAPKDLLYLKMPFSLREWTNPSRNDLVHPIDPEIPWVLRNLSKKEYVRADVLALDPENVQGPFIPGMSFGSLVTSRICWSSDPSMSIANAEDHNLHRGVWAGDRFDIVEISEVDDNWIDVTAAAKKVLSAIWQSEYGDNWKEEVATYEF